MVVTFHSWAMSMKVHVSVPLWQTKTFLGKPKVVPRKVTEEQHESLGPGLVERHGHRMRCGSGWWLAMVFYMAVANPFKRVEMVQDNGPRLSRENKVEQFAIKEGIKN